MNKQYINIAITGLSSNHSDELKTQLRNLIPQEYQINWSSAADPTIDCLFIHESFYETEGIQKIIRSRQFPWLKFLSKPITKTDSTKIHFLYQLRILKASRIGLFNIYYIPLLTINKSFLSKLRIKKHRTN